MTKILLVEDDKSLREIYGTRLMAEGYEIVSAGDGEEALAMAIKERPVLIVSDVMMPKISGFDMLDILRSTTETKDVKVIMMTALSSEEQRARGEALGADRYLVKSQVGIEDVVRTVHEVLGDNGGVAAPAPAPDAAAGPAEIAPEPMAAPVEPDPAPMPEPAMPAEPVASTPAPIAPEPIPAPAAPIDPVVAPSAPEPAVAASVPPMVNAPAPAPMPVAPEPMAAPVEPDPAPMPAPEAPAPAGGLPDFSAMMSQELGAAPAAPAPVEPAPAPMPAPEAPAPEAPQTPPTPPAPTV